MAEIHPALTPEEWDELLAAGRAEDEVERSMKLNRQRRVMVDGALTARRYTAAAAIALHGQSSGFTWEDVAWLRAIASSPSSEEEQAAWANGLADRVAAMLPPRPT